MQLQNQNYSFNDNNNYNTDIVGLRVLVSQISKQAATANPDTNINNVQQLLTSLNSQLIQIYGQDKALEEIRHLYAQSIYYPHGITMQSLSKLTQYFANQGTKYNSPVIQQIVNEQKNTNYIPQSIANVAVQVVSMNNTINTNQLINSIAKSISNQTASNVSVKNKESVIKQI